VVQFSGSTIKIVRRFQADLDSGLNINQACRKAGIGITTHYRWKAPQENPISGEHLHASELEAENGRLKLLVAELALDARMLKEALKKGHDFRPSSSHRQ
jgi:putative transposase